MRDHRVQESEAKISLTGRRGALRKSMQATCTARSRRKPNAMSPFNGWMNSYTLST